MAPEALAGRALSRGGAGDTSTRVSILGGAWRPAGGAAGFVSTADDFAGFVSCPDSGGADAVGVGVEDWTGGDAASGRWLAATGAGVGEAAAAGAEFRPTT